MKVDELLPFIKEIDRLKIIERQTLIHEGSRRENSAEHSWHLALAVIVFEKISSEPLDLFKAVKMALLHDIVEIDAGDIIIYGDHTNKKIDETAAIKRIMSLLPSSMGEEFEQLWHEFEEGNSAEAKFVAALDRFLPLYSNYLNNGYSWNNHNVKRQKVIEKCQPSIEAGIPSLWALAQKMIEESANRGILKN